jgi:hypothetical protein
MRDKTKEGCVCWVGVGEGSVYPVCLFAYSGGGV